MSEKFIEWELKNNPGIFSKISEEGFIDKQVLRHVICNVNKPEFIAQEQFEAILNAVVEETDLIPAADAAPVELAHWVQANDIDETAWRCSKCDLTWILDEGAPSENEMKYCPKCGAKMDEGV